MGYSGGPLQPNSTLRVPFHEHDGRLEADDSLDFDLPEIPHSGDYICIQRGADLGQLNFIVRRTWWHLKHKEHQTNVDPGVGSTAGITVECEYAVGPHSTDAHKKAGMVGGKEPRKFEDAAF